MQELTRREKLDNSIDTFLASPATYTKKFLNIRDIKYIEKEYPNLTVQSSTEMNSRQQILCKISR